MLRLAAWILRSNPMLGAYWKWLANMGFDPVSPRRIVLSVSNGDSTSDTLPESIDTPWHRLASHYITTGWRWTWYLVTTPGSGESGGTGADSGQTKIVCILEPMAEEPNEKVIVP